MAHKSAETSLNLGTKSMAEEVDESDKVKLPEDDDCDLFSDESYSSHDEADV